MNDKKALIIGGSGGIGMAVTGLFVANGIRTYATYHENAQKLREVRGLEADRMIECDIREEESVKKAVDHVIAEESGIDIVINAVTGALKLKPFEKLSYPEFFEDVQIILMGAVNLYRQIVPVMKKARSGLIINILTATIDNPPSRMSSYVSAKSGLSGLAKSLSVELKPYNIKVLGISPSFVETDLIKAFPGKLLEMEAEKNPDGKLIQSHDIAQLVLDVVNRPERYDSGRNLVLETRQAIAGLIER